jgi:imidazolonepropionase-like amidohydrolase
MFVIQAGQLIDGNGGLPLRDMAVVVKEGLIDQIVPIETLQLPPDVQVVDARRQTLMPGMIDCHLHIHTAGGPEVFNDYAMLPLTESQGMLALRGLSHVRKDLEMGFTSLRVVDAPHYIDVALRDAINQGYVAGPRLKVAGQGICVTGGHMDKAYWTPDVTVAGRTGVGDGPWECRRAAREQLKRGVDLIKINAAGGSLDLAEPWHQEMTYEEMAAIIEEAHWAKKRVAAHAHGGPGITEALRAGLDSVEHGVWLSEEQCGIMAERGVCYVPTLCTHSRGLQLGKQGTGSSEDGWKWLVKACEDRWISLDRAHKAGVKICVGTDAGFWMYHGENASELEELVRGGLTTMQAIVAATRNGAENLGIDHLTGTLDVGKTADLLVVDGDPLADVGILRERQNIARVYKAGVLIRSNECG